MEPVSAAFVGHALSPEELAEIQSLINSVVMVEPDVQKQPAARRSHISTTRQGLLSVTIQYIYRAHGVPQTLNFNVPAYGS
ncbi:hypothetical protein [Paraburkholderia sp. SOS3]|uniref:hypothetical protein n=1 Tax=Paraburkholderia sp. SOS3 TaxID=1926494 RepID=UPI0009477B7B|nr:hypothetical protein [Paraburkholderia sp. SOS3]APR40493.1 hypothetical protein BTO02_33675 [Paraburkholderia sp. SOS3]